jgi:ankyrin repeat protein
MVDRAHPRIAARMFADDPALASGNASLACAIGDEDALRRAASADPAWVNRPEGPLNLPPLVAVTHSSLLQLAEFRDALHRCARFLLSAGADPNQRIGNRWPPASLAEPDETQPLSALLGAAGETRDADLTRLLLDAGADPNDGESLYHALEDPTCTNLLLEHGAIVSGSNVLYRMLDLDQVETLRLLLRHGGDPNEPARNRPLSDWGSPLMWAIRRRRSAAHVEALLSAGADASARTASGVGAYRLALQLGLTEVAELLRERGQTEPLSEEDLFLAACARGDADEAGRIRARRPDLPGSLPDSELAMLPEMAAEGVDGP